MKIKLQSFIAILFVLTFLTSVKAQTLNQIKEKRFQLDYGDVILLTGFALDVGSSLNKQESNPLWRNSIGIFSPSKNIVFKSSLFGAFKLLEFHYHSSHDRKRIRWFKVGIGIAFTGLAIRNFRK